MSREISVKLKDIRGLGALQCTHKEAAAFLDIRVSTWHQLLIKNPSVRKAFDQGKELGKRSLRRKQFSLAGVNAQMAIWLGRQILNQKEVVTNELTGAEGGPIELDLGQLSREERDALRQLLNRATRPSSGR